MKAKHNREPEIQVNYLGNEQDLGNSRSQERAQGEEIQVDYIGEERGLGSSGGRGEGRGGSKGESSDKEQSDVE